MAHPSFTDRSFVQLARRALARCSYDISWPLREAYIARAKLKDARAALCAHPMQSRAADRRYVIHMRARSAAALVAASINREAIPARVAAGAVNLAEAVA